MPALFKGGKWVGYSIPKGKGNSVSSFGAKKAGKSIFIASLIVNKNPQEREKIAFAPRARPSKNTELGKLKIIGKEERSGDIEIVNYKIPKDISRTALDKIKSELGRAEYGFQPVHYKGKLDYYVLKVSRHRLKD